MKTINIYPCVNSLLYAPIYLAIESYSYRSDHRLKSVEPGVDDYGHNYKEWTYTDGYRIRLFKEAGDDAENYNRLKDASHNSDSEVHIAIGDPATALARDASNPGRPAEDDYRFRVIGNFVNRIALWGFCQKKRGKHVEVNGQLKNLVTAGSFGTAPLFVPNGPYSKVRLGYSPRGATTATVMKHFASAGFAPPDRAPSDMGLQELQGVLADDYDLTFTYSPWLLRSILDEQNWNDYAVLPWFQAVPYPFSALIVYANKTTEDAASHLLQEFVQHIIIGVAFLCRFKDSAIEMLKHRSANFNFYGIDRSRVQGKDWDQIIRDAISSLVLADVYCESLESTWVAWDLAIAAVAGTSKTMRERLFGEVLHLETRPYISTVASKHFNEVYFPKVMSELLNNANA